jgi:hypothetical protein
MKKQKKIYSLTFTSEKKLLGLSLNPMKPKPGFFSVVNVWV